MNVAIVLGGGFFFSLLLDSRLPRHENTWKMLTGFLFGLLCVFSMLSPVQIREGVIIDSKYPLALISTIYGGPLSGAITAIIAGSARALKGGMGVYAALPTLLVTWLTACAYLRFVPKPANTLLRLQHYLVLGIIQWVYQILGGAAFFFFVPWQEAVRIVIDRSLPAILVYPATTLLLGWSLDLVNSRHALLRNLQQTDITFRIIFEKTPLRIGIYRISDNVLMLANPAFFRSFGHNANERADLKMDTVLGIQVSAMLPEIQRQLKMKTMAELPLPNTTNIKQSQYFASLGATTLEIAGSPCIMMILLPPPTAPSSIGQGLPPDYC